MAWLVKTKRLNKKTNRKEVYYAIAYRDKQDKVRTQAIGFRTADEAKTALKIFEGKQAAGEDVTPTPTTPGSSVETKIPTLRSYLQEKYLPVIKRDKSAKTYSIFSTAANTLIAQMGDQRLTELTYTVIDEHISARKAKGRRSRTIIIELRVLKACLTHAQDSGVLENLPKFPKIRDIDRQPHRFLTDAQAVALLAALRPLEEQPHVVTRGKPPVQRDQLTYLAVLMALNCGMRRNEILTRGWEDIRWREGRYGVMLIGAKREVDFQVKTRRERVIPLTPELRTALEDLHRSLGSPNSGWIFPSPRDTKKPRKDFSQALKRACKRAGLPPIHPHGLRHTWASRLAMAGVDRRTLMELGGWQEGRMLDEIYAHTTDAHKVDVMARMGISDTDKGEPDKD